MIYKVSCFPDLVDKSYLTLNIKCLFKGFSGYNIAPDLWLQKDENIDCLILKYGETAYISHFGGDLDELECFLKSIGIKKLFTNKMFSFINIQSEYSVFKKRSCKTALPFPNIPPLSLLYEGLKYGDGSDINLPPFSEFAPDVSHLLRHGQAFCVCEDFGAALVYTDGLEGILKGIAVKKELRLKGMGRRLLESLSDYCPNGIFAATTKSNDFYLKSGFEKEPYNIYFGELK